MTETNFPTFPSYEPATEGFSITPGTEGVMEQIINSSPPESTFVLGQGTFVESFNITQSSFITGNQNVVIQPKDHKTIFTIQSEGVLLQNFIIDASELTTDACIEIQSGKAIFDNITIISKKACAIKIHSNAELYLRSCKLFGEIDILDHSIFVDQDCTISHSPEIVNSETLIARNNSKFFTKASQYTGHVLLIDNSSIYASQTSFCYGVELTTASKNNILLECTFYPHLEPTEVDKNSSQLISICSSGTNSESDSGAIQINGCQFDCCSTALFATDYFPVTIINSTFKSSRLVTENTNITLTDTSFCESSNLSQFNSTSPAVSLQFDEGTIATLNKVNFSSLTGSVISAHNATLSIDDCSFKEIGNTGIELSDNSSVKVSKCTFTNAVYGLLSCGTVSGSFNECKFELCTRAGSRVSENDSLLSFDSCQWISNAANGFESSKAAANFNNCDFTSNAGIGLDLKDFSGDEFQLTNSRILQNLFSGLCLTNVNNINITKTIIDLNQQTGICIIGSSPHFSDLCSISQNTGIGVAIVQGSRPTFQSCVFKENIGYAIQVEHPNTSVSFSQCEVGLQKSGGAILTSSCSAHFHMCSLHDNAASDIEGRDSANILIEQCELWNSANGVGIMASQNAKITVQSSAIHDEKQTGILATDGGVINVTCSEIKNCEICGICMQSNSSGQITQNLIHDNLNAGIIIVDGSPIVNNNQIENSPYGISATGGSPQISDNIFNNIVNQQ